MDHATSLSQVQRANLNLLLLMRDAAMRDMGDAVCSFGLARQDFAAIMSRAPDELLSFVCGIGDRALFLPRSDLSSLLALPPACLLYTSPSPRDRTRSRMPSSA